MADLRPITRPVGRNDWDDLITGPANLAAELQNLDPYEGGIGKKRHGVTKPSVTSVANMTDPVDGWGDASVVLTADNQIFGLQMGQDVAGGTPTTVLVILGRTQHYCIITTSGSSQVVQTNWQLTYDSAAAFQQAMLAVVIHGKLVVAGKSTENRLSVDQSVLTPISGTTARKANIKAPAAATVADTGGGAYPAALRYYRVAWAFFDGTGILLRSNLGPSVSFTPSGAGAAARITRPALAGEIENRWEIYASVDDVTYYKIATVDTATTTYDDSALVASYSSNPLAPREGSNYPFPSVKFIRYAFNRLIGFGRYETTAGDSILTRDGHLYFSPPRGADYQYVDEIVRDCVDEKGYMPLAENANGVDRGLSDVCNGSIYAFQDRGIFQITLTGNTTTPLKSTEITKQYGAVSHQSIQVGEDNVGRPCVYFLDPQDGLRRIGPNGIEWCGKDVIGVWEGVNLSATVRVAHALWVSKRKQLWIWLATGTDNRPRTMLVLDVTAQYRDERGDWRGGWHVWTDMLAGGGSSSSAMSATMYGSNLNDPGSKLVPYMMLDSTVGRSSTKLMPPYLYAVPFTGVGLEEGAQDFEAYFLSKAFSELGKGISVDGVNVLAEALSSGVIRVSAIGDVGLGSSQQKDGQVSLTASGTQTMIFRQAEGVTLNGIWTVQFRVGDITGTKGVGQWHLRDLYVAVDQGAKWISRG